jgi:6,7-dimethyl-8-ribityllumazine synthase
MRVHEGKPDGAGLRIGIVASRFNTAVTERLLSGATEALRRHGLADGDVELVRVSGAFEIPLAAHELAETGRVDAIVCIGAVVRGETPHFDYIAASVVSEISRLSVQHGLPMTLGILTTDSIDQALARSGGGHGNKGEEAAVTAIEMANLCRSLRHSRPKAGDSNHG